MEKMDIEEKTISRINNEAESVQSFPKHDLINNSQIVQGYLELLDSTNLSEEQKKYLEKAMNAEEKNINLIENSA